jgi:hypothetical protein
VTDFFVHSAWKAKKANRRAKSSLKQVRCSLIDRTVKLALLELHLAHKLREMGHELSAETINRVYDEFVRLADSKKQIYDQDLLSILIALRAKMPVSQMSLAPGYHQECLDSKVVGLSGGCSRVLAPGAFLKYPIKALRCDLSLRSLGNPGGGTMAVSYSPERGQLVE